MTQLDPSASPAREALARSVLETVAEIVQDRAEGLTVDSDLTEYLDSLQWLELRERLETLTGRDLPALFAHEVRTARQLALALSELDESPEPGQGEIDPGRYLPERFSEYLDLRRTLAAAAAAGEADPFLVVHDGTSGATTHVDGREVINFSGYNYLGLAGAPAVSRAAHQAIERYGTSVSASRLISGTRPVHVELEREIAGFLGVSSAITFPSGHSTNTAVIGHLMGPEDLVVHDERAHNSVVGGCLLSGADRRAFAHNDAGALDVLLGRLRHRYRRVLVVVEAVYSMDGDLPDLAALVEVKTRHRAMIMVDEAHSIGVVGATGRGIGEQQKIRRGDVEVWMGTLSKALASCGGFVAGSREIIDYLAHTCPGVVYTAGVSPANAAAALAALRLLRAEPSRVATLRARAAYFLEGAGRLGMDTGASSGTAIVPVILGDPLGTVRAARRMLEEGVSVPPILPPAVEPAGSRLRFFINAEHSEEQLDLALRRLAEILAEIDPAYLGRERRSAAAGVSS